MSKLNFIEIIKKKQKERKIKAIAKRYKKYIKFDDMVKILSEEEPIKYERKKSDRLVISIVNSEKSPVKTSPELYEHASNVTKKSKIFILESLMPIPMLSASLDSIDFEKLGNVIIDLIGTENKFRIVCGIGLAEIGIFGNSSRMAYGSYGDVTLNVIEGIFRLPSTNSWVDEKVANLLKLPLIEGHKILKSTFYKYN